MAEDHQLASTFLVEVHDAIAHLPGATPAREKLLRKSLDYLNGLTRDAGEDPALHRALATAYEKFAELQSGTVGAGLGKSHEALETTRKALRIREMLAKRSKDPTIQLELANNYLLMAFLIGRASSSDERLDFDKNAITIAERLYEADPKNHDFVDLLARSYTSSGYALAARDRWDEARKHFRRALTLRTNTLSSAKDPTKAQRELARIHYRLGAGYAQAGQSREAIGYLRQALNIQQPLSTASPNDESMTSDTAATLHFLGVAYRGIGDTAEALAAFNTAIATREVSLARDPQNARSRSLLAGNLAERGTALLNAGRDAEGLKDLRRALELETAIIEVDPRGTSARFAMADFQSRLGEAHAKLAKQSSGSQAQLYWREAAKYYRRADALFAALGGEGLLGSTPARNDAKRAADGAAEAGRHITSD